MAQKILRPMLHGLAVLVFLMAVVPAGGQSPAAAATGQESVGSAHTARAAGMDPDPIAVWAAAKAAGLDSLTTVAPPPIDNLEDFLNPGPEAQRRAVVLGKALFWDMQVGSDGQACASCHFAAGADNRSKNQLSPGLRANPQDTTFGNSVAAGVPGFSDLGPNHALANNNFPLTLFQDPLQVNFKTRAITKETNDVVSSQGVFLADFAGVVPGQLHDKGTPVSDPIFNVGGVNVRRVAPRNTPSVINAAFNLANFWDGRASADFNGVSPLGPLDTDAKILVREGSALRTVQITIPNSSLASQAVGPPLSDMEMSYAGRTFPDIGKKLAAVKPLAFQQVNPDDSVLGSLASPDGLPGLTTATYADLIKAVFQPKYWDAANVITFPDGVRTINAPGVAAPQGLTAYTQMEANFSLFFGLAIQAYERTLVSDMTPFDRFMAGDNSSLTTDQLKGLLIFINEGLPETTANPLFAGIGQGNCVACHVGAELTAASVANLAGQPTPSFDVSPSLSDGKLVNGIVPDRLLDEGFFNIGVRPTGDDIGRGGTELGMPLSWAREAQLGIFGMPLPAGSTAITNSAGVDGAFKTPGLRNVELTAPYFHNGGQGTLTQVVDFYQRQGDFSDANIANLYDDLSEVKLKPGDGEPLVAFLRSLTDERVRNEQAPFDHPQLFLPDGHPGNATAINKFATLNGVKVADDTRMELPAVGAGGKGTSSLPVIQILLTVSGVAVLATILVIFRAPKRRARIP